MIDILDFESPETFMESLVTEKHDPLLQSDRDTAIALIKKNYIGKYPIEYFEKNTNLKHDKIIAVITHTDSEEEECKNYLASMMRTLNDMNREMVFFFRDMDKTHIYIIANPKQIEDPKKNAAEILDLQDDSTPGEKDIFECFFLDDFKYAPVVQHYMHNGVSLRNAVNMMECLCISNPFYRLDALSERMFKTDEEYDTALLETFVDICNEVDDGSRLFYEALERPFYQVPTMEDSSLVKSAVKKVKSATATIDNKVKGAVDSAKDVVTKDDSTGKRGIERTANEVKHKLSPIAEKIKETLDELIGEKAEKEEVIKNSQLLKIRRIFFKILIAYKSKPLLMALAAIPGGIPGLLLKMVVWIAGAYWTMKQAGEAAGAVGGKNEEMRRKLVAELELELKMVREKIEDARSDGDRKAKYELIRVENKLENEIYRIKYNKDPDKFLSGETRN